MAPVPASKYCLNDRCPKQVTAIDPGSRKPRVERIYGSLPQIDCFIVLSFDVLCDRLRERAGGVHSTVNGVSTVSCSLRKLALSLRHRPPDANATIKMARSRMSRRPSVPGLPVALTGRHQSPPWHPCVSFKEGHRGRVLKRGFGELYPRNDRRQGCGQEPTGRNCLVCPVDA